MAILTKTWVLLGVINLALLMLTIRNGAAMRLVRRVSAMALNVPKLAFSTVAINPMLFRMSTETIPFFRRFASKLNMKSQFHQSTALSSAKTEPVAEIAEKKPIEYFRKDYKPSPYVIRDIELLFKLDDIDTIVTARNTVVRNHGEGLTEDMLLDGEELELLSVSINGQTLNSLDYTYTDDKLAISSQAISKHSTLSSFVLETVSRINPSKNLALSGLYRSGQSLLCTQCEAMGFRRITFSLDRPDVLSKYKVRLEGDKLKYPLLLSNGNLVASGDVDATNHYAVWEDPFPKPSYLFAIVAGDLGSIHDTYTTSSGRVVSLGIYSDKQNAAKLDHAMYSLKESMKWDEDTFGLECDLDIYNVVATDDFNMGAMENKGLNIFNSALLLADPSTATDADYERILGVIGHEYFHNWSGNRVTVRDWFQLTLKEGLTVFRDQWFTADKTSAAVKRIEDVRGLRSRQFAEDASPMSHPIRPESYISMDNFYTATVYSKGAEVIGIYKTLLGEDRFKKGLALYFQRHDGQAVTCDDFRQAMSDANGVDLGQMDRWYSQAGTPNVKITSVYHAEEKKLVLTAQQFYSQDASETRLPVVIPLVTGLIGKHSGNELAASKVLILKDAQQEFVFDGVHEEPIISTLRGYSAPVLLDMPLSHSDLAVLMAHDTDAFNRWEASNRYYTSLILDFAKSGVSEGSTITLPDEVVTAVRSILHSVDQAQDLSLLAYALQLPDHMTLFNIMSPLDLDSLIASRKLVKQSLALALEEDFRLVYEKLSTSAGNEKYVFNPQEVGRRRLRNTCLDYLSNIPGSKHLSIVKHQYDTATCMTDKLSALSHLVSMPSEESSKALANFYEAANGQMLVINKWFSVQALGDDDACLDRLLSLEKHSDFIISNPNRARSLYSVAAGNIPLFHRKDGKGYEFVAQAVLKLDAINPQVAARLAGSFGMYKKLDADRQSKVRDLLSGMVQQQKLSPDTYEIVTRFLR